MSTPLLRRSMACATVSTIVMIVALGTVLRLADPLSSNVIPAEDPYTHMALVREHLRQGELDPLYTNGDLYPPGIHAFLAAVWVYTGLDLYAIFLFGPVVMGAIGIIGMALLLWRFVGVAASIVGSLAYAVAPEVIFRTTMMSPTAIDLGLLPFFLFALMQVATGRIRWLAVALPVAAFLVFLHPWLLGLLCLMGVAFAILSLLQSPRPNSTTAVTTGGLLAAASVLAAAMAGVLSTCGGYCGPGFQDVLPVAAFGTVVSVGLFIASAVLLGVSAFSRGRLRTIMDARLPSLPHAPPIAISVLLVGAFAAMTYVAWTRGFPEYVDLPRMFGWPILLLAAIGLAVVPFRSNPLANAAASLAIATFPLVVFNPMDSPFWPHRTAVFLGIGLILLAGVAVQALGAAATLAARHIRWPSASPRPSNRAFALTAFAAILVPAALAGTVYGATPDGYEGGWYRLYRPCEQDAFKAIAAQADLEPKMIVVTGSWQGKVVLGALASDTSRIWMSTGFYTDASVRQRIIDEQAPRHPILVVLERILLSDHPDANTSFLRGDDWIPMGAWCAGVGGFASPRVEAFVLRESLR